MTTGGNPAQGFLLFLFLQIVSQKALQLKPLLPKATRASPPISGSQNPLSRLFTIFFAIFNTHTYTH